ncbi:hypothetical protein B0H34DRAFT_656811 [Crassisporium funariophilum]|nr:hypothetical protein B0H34DRAFT_656811 [Crassisporium funariophilum]
MPCQAANRRDTAYDQLALSSRGLYNPKIKSPTNATVWTMGSDVVVTWDLHDMPEKKTNPKGTLILGHMEEGSDDEHMDLEHPLARDFDIAEGSVNFKCPKVDASKQYIVVLFGDSGNRSPAFKIRK